MDERRTQVLVIDDDPKLVRLVALMLGREHEVVGLTSAREALARIAGGARFDLILCDIMMQPVTGADFHGLLRKLAPELVDRIVFTTGGAFTPWAEALLQQPSIRWIDKPFPPLEEFRAMVQEHVRRLGRLSAE
jgi:CheY-like chemotaxis protein